MALDLNRAAISDLRRALDDRRLSVAELTAAHLQRMATVNPKINAVTLPDPAGAQAAAAELDRELAAGKIRSPLHGIPVTIKDLFATRGQRTAAGSLILRDRITDHDAEMVTRLREAGAVILGKTLMDEFAFSPTGRNAHYGPVLNPWDTARAPGGSSSGAAAALAAGVGIGALGTDTGGSVRLPAALCGVVGFKPSYDRLSRSGVFPLAPSLDHPGVFARSVADLRAIFDCVAEPGSRLAEPHTIAPHGLRFGVIEEHCRDLDGPVSAAWNDFIGALDQAGVRLETVAPKHLTLTLAVSTAVMFAEAAMVHRRWLDTQREAYSEEIRMRLLQGALIPATTYLRALQLRRLMAEEFAALFTRFDCLICPTNLTVAPLILEIDAKSGGRMIRNTRLAPLLGIPAISVPLAVRGLPIGAQLHGPFGGDGRLLDIAVAIEIIVGRAAIPPE
ncbi:MAG: amidase [Candidatus Binataceae bacterium]|nr:amidase [Candidatus Binataceae bacterium]